MSEFKHHFRAAAALRNQMIDSLPISEFIRDAIKSETVATVAISITPICRFVFTPTETFASFNDQPGDLTHLTPCAESDIPADEDEDDQEEDDES